MDESVRISLRMSDAGADDEKLDELTRLLRDELLGLEVDVQPGPGESAPAGTRSVELAALGTLFVTLSQSTVLATLIQVVANWLGQRRQRSVKLELDGDVLELTGVPSAQQRELAAAWLSRHAQSQPTPRTARRHALIIANYEYQDRGLRELRAPSHDADQLARVLRDPDIGGFTVRTMRNQPAPAISEAVEEFFADRGPDELLLLHFSGHGVKDEDGELYFAAANTKLNRLGATGVAADFIKKRMNRSSSRRIVLFLDCCYAGAFGRGMVARAGGPIALREQFGGGKGRAVITASSAMEYAFEGQHVADMRNDTPSVFTSALVEGLDTGDADRDQDGFVGLDELYEYVYERVRQATPNQTPGKWTFDLQGDLHIARRSRPVTEPARLPGELQEAIDHPLSGMRAGAVGELGRLLTSKHGGLALAARLALQRLGDDDSRTVATAATKALGTVSRPETVPKPPVKASRPAAPREASPAPAAPPVTSPPPQETSPPPSTATTRSEPPLSREASPAPPPPRRPEPSSPSARRRFGADQLRGALARVLAGASAVMLAILYAYDYPAHWFGQVDYARLPWQPLLGTVLLMLLITTALAVAAGYQKSAAAVQGIMLASAGGLAGILGALGADGSPSLDDGWWPVAMIGLLLAMAAVAVGAITGPAQRAALVAAGAVCALLAFVILMESSPAWAFTLHLPVIAFLLGMIVTQAVQQARRHEAARHTWFGLTCVGLITADAIWASSSESLEISNAIFVAALLVVLLAGLVAGEEDRLTVVARTMIILLLVLHAPLYRAEEDDVAVLHIALELAAAGFAFAAYFAAQKHQPRGA